MPSVLVIPIQTTTSGGYVAEVREIHPDDHDCLIGEVVTPGAGRIKCRWNSGGTARDATQACNLDMGAAELAGIGAIARKLNN